MFHFMKKEKTEEEKAEKVRKKSDKRDRKDKKARNASALSADDLERLAEIRKSLKMSKAEAAVLSGMTAEEATKRNSVVGLSYSQQDPRGEWSASSSETTSYASKTGSLSSQGRVKSILKSRGGSSVVSPSDLDLSDQNLLFKNTLQNSEYVYTGGANQHQEQSSQDRDLTYSYLAHSRVEVADVVDAEGRTNGEELGLKAKRLLERRASLPNLLTTKEPMLEVEVGREEVSLRRLAGRKRGVLVEAPSLSPGLQLVAVEGEEVEGRGREEVASRLAECRASRVVLGVRALPEVAELKGGGIEQRVTKVGKDFLQKKYLLSLVDNGQPRQQLG